MGLPKKALRKSNLIVRKKIINGSHEIFFVEFVEDGKVKTGYYKKLDDQGHYPAFLAKISVAVSVILRLFQGDQVAATEYLVFDDDVNNPQIDGTLSLTLDGFKPLPFKNDINASSDNNPPKVDKLIKYNMTLPIVGRWICRDDDTHSGNIGFREFLDELGNAYGWAAHLDYGMFFYSFSCLAKDGGRKFVDRPKASSNLTREQYHNFPDRWISYHNPTSPHPGATVIMGMDSLPNFVKENIAQPILGYSLPKAYADPGEFIKLAGRKEARKQMMDAVLRQLLTFQPLVLRKRLQEYLGDLSLSYKDLPEIKRKEYEKKFPHLCNKNTNNKPFIDVMMQIYQECYDHIYRIVITDMGCESNRHGLQIKSTNEELFNNPSYYQTILKWVEEQNATLYEDNVESQLNLSHLEARYHKIWRDSYTIRFADLSFLTRKVIYQYAKRYDQFKVVLSEADMGMRAKVLHTLSSSKDTENFDQQPEVTEAVQYFPFQQGFKILSETEAAQNNPHHELLNRLISFNNNLQQLLHQYYQKNIYDADTENNLNIDDNKLFITKLAALCEEMGEEIFHGLYSQDQDAAQTFATIKNELRSIAAKMDFAKGLKCTDQERLAQMTLEKPLVLTQEEVLEYFAEQLYSWVNTLTEDEFEKIIDEALNLYRPLLTTGIWRTREEDVKRLMKQSVNNEQKLADILCEGHIYGALNVQVMTLCIQKMLDMRMIPGVVRENKEIKLQFELSSYIGAAQKFRDYGLSYPRQSSLRQHYFDETYAFLLQLKESEVMSMVREGVAEYKKTKSWITASRENEIYETVNKYPIAEAVMRILSSGDETSTASHHLFKAVISKIKNSGRENLIPLVDFMQNNGQKYNKYLKVMAESKLPLIEQEKKVFIQTIFSWIVAMSKMDKFKNLINQLDKKAAPADNIVPYLTGLCKNPKNLECFFEGAIKLIKKTANENIELKTRPGWALIEKYQEKYKELYTPLLKNVFTDSLKIFIKESNRTIFFNTIFTWFIEEKEQPTNKTNSFFKPGLVMKEPLQYLEEVAANPNSREQFFDELIKDMKAWCLNNKSRVSDSKRYLFIEHFQNKEKQEYFPWFEKFLKEFIQTYRVQACRPAEAI
ncbi:MAG: hypothetical protein BGO90_10835 [Legionella sp. 40-6]|nr:hypothetical protein [Legionella sp.]OJY46816.1 MAG: hypothetical protein BGO90_10835 [Legionella sp. 40-6]